MLGICSKYFNRDTARRLYICARTICASKAGKIDCRSSSALAAAHALGHKKMARRGEGGIPRKLSSKLPPYHRRTEKFPGRLAARRHFAAGIRLRHYLYRFLKPRQFVYIIADDFCRKSTRSLDWFKHFAPIKNPRRENCKQRSFASSEHHERTRDVAGSRQSAPQSISAQ